MRHADGAASSPGDRGGGRARHRYAVFDQSLHRLMELNLSVDSNNGVGGELVMPDATLDLAKLKGVYVRLMDDRFLPDLADSSASVRDRSRSLHNLLRNWLNVAPGRIANRPRSMLSNASKTYQTNIIRKFGFGIPDTLVTNDPAEVVDFVARCKSDGDEVIYKSISGTRSIVQSVGPEDMTRLNNIRWCPTQFQRKVVGVDLRVHVVGQRAFAAEIASSATDYRYSERQTGTDAKLVPTDISSALEASCVELATALELPFAGVDLRRTPEGKYICFEVNPCPAYSYYESHTALPIARGLVSWLAGYEVD